MNIYTEPVNVSFVNLSRIDLRSFMKDLDLPPIDSLKPTVFFVLVPTRNMPPKILRYPGPTSAFVVLPPDQWDYPDEPLFFHYSIGFFAASKMFKFVEDLLKEGLIAYPQFFL